ncbi:recombinase family protein [Ruegeria arenilitoris]|uniref:DNA-invertase hin n=1 Tax=Ruegeria arenilitoris TaxID=1173585 RepID=A0A238K1Y7_9RHOB|nr:recombinase family protein [Ruegeria arenilitoris]SMX36467.1 DNA-invertase hin [Ruegeria arenilitoris]
MLIGYARVSTSGQTLETQIDKLEAAGVEKIFKEKKSGARADAREQLNAMLDYVREGDVVVITKMDRMARSMRDLLNLVAQLDEKGVGLKVLDQAIDTTTPEGKMTYQILGVVSEFELAIRKQRIDDGVARLREQGIEPFKGRPPKIKKEEVEKAIEETGSKAAAAKKLGISRDSVYRVLRQAA